MKTAAEMRLEAAAAALRQEAKDAEKAKRFVEDQVQTAVTSAAALGHFSTCIDDAFRSLTVGAQAEVIRLLETHGYRAAREVIPGSFDLSGGLGFMPTQHYRLTVGWK